jgi:general secretion pathway protein N
VIKPKQSNQANRARRGSAVKRTLWLIFFGVLVFAGIVVSRLPASWVLPGPQSGVTCSDADGTIWNGTCNGLTVQQQPVGDLSWEVHASRLLAGKLNADILITRPAGAAQGNVEVGLDKIISARDIKVDLPLDQALVAALPPNLQGLRGKIHAELAHVRVEGQTLKLKAIEGVVEAQDLTDGEGRSAQRWGSYSLTFPPSTGGDPVGQLRDLGGGPLAVEGSLRLTPEPGYDLEGLVKARPTAPAELAQDIQFLGSPDAQGRRPFGLSGTF